MLRKKFLFHDCWDSQNSIKEYMHQERIFEKYQSSSSGCNRWNYQTTNVIECFFWEATENSANNDPDEQ